MNMHSITELDVDGLCRISRNNWGKELCLIFYLEATIGLFYVLHHHAQKYIGLDGFFKINFVSNSI
jgi:hypothetical protein